MIPSVSLAFLNSVILALGGIEWKRRGGQQVLLEPDAIRHRVRILHIVSHPIQYFVPLYRELTARGVDLTVCYFRSDGDRPYHDADFRRELQWDIPLLDGYRYKFLPSPAWRGGFSIGAGFKIVCALAMGHFDAVWIHGYSSLNNVAALLAARILGVPTLLRDEATLLDWRPALTRRMKWLFFRIVANKAYGLYIGSQNEAFFRHYGFSEDRLFFASYSVDNHYFERQATALAPARNRIRSAFGIPDDRPVILFCGKLIAKKDPLTLLEAFAMLRKRMSCALLFAGDGHLREDIVRLAATGNIPDVHVSGFLNQSEVARAYMAADIFVLPSVHRETWGLVVNEAMNFGLPIVCSDRVGCAADLVHDNENGLVFTAGSPESLHGALSSLISDPKSRSSFGLRSKQIIQDWGVDQTATRLVNSFEAIVRNQTW
jgi:glycosyltransferase involved in cell wall biosynthesis